MLLCKDSKPGASPQAKREEAVSCEAHNRKLILVFTLENSGKSKSRAPVMDLPGDGSWGICPPVRKEGKGKPR